MSASPYCADTPHAIGGEYGCTASQLETRGGRESTVERRKTETDISENAVDMTQHGTVNCCMGK